VTAVDVDLDTKLVTVQHDDASPTLQQLAAAIERQGYEVAGSEAL
jgi:copper chaperone CopZ